MNSSISLRFRGLVSLAMLAAAAFLAGCAGTPAKPFDYAAFKAAKPRSILVLPPTNVSPDIHGTAGVMAQSVRPLAEAGYYVYPASLVVETFQQNGVTAAADAQSVSPQKLRDIFGADAALYINVTKYGTSYKVFDSETVVAAEARLLDLRTGAVLWNGEASASSNEGRNNSSQGIAGILLSAVINQIVASASDASFQVAGTASARLLGAGRPNGMLYGPRSPKYQSD